MSNLARHSTDEPRFEFTWNVVARGKVVDTIRAATYTEALDHVRCRSGSGARLSAPGAPTTGRTTRTRRKQGTLAS
jgi:hypothetical protein